MQPPQKQEQEPQLEAFKDQIIKTDREPYASMSLMNGTSDQTFFAPVIIPGETEPTISLTAKSKTTLDSSTISSSNILPLQENNNQHKEHSISSSGTQNDDFEKLVAEESESKTANETPSQPFQEGSQVGAPDSSSLDPQLLQALGFLTNTEQALLEADDKYLLPTSSLLYHVFLRFLHLNLALSPLLSLTFF